ncbi:hypothetical protein Dimus_036465, partial [Dionaea muscipula]
RQKWENLFKRRELVHIDVVKEFYAKMIVIHSKKKDIVKSKVRGIEMEFDHEKSATIQEVWEESKYTKPLEITRRFANDENIMATRRVKSGELKPFQRFIHFLVMKNVVPRIMNSPYGDRLTMVFEAFGVPLVDKKGEEPKRYDFFEETFLTMCKLTRENGIWWIGSGENRRRDDDVNAPEEDAEEEEERNKDDFDWEAVIDEATVEGESGSGEKFYDAEEEAQGSPDLHDEIPAEAPPSSAQQKDKGIAGVDPSGHAGRETDFLKFQAEFERKRANRFHDDLEKAKAENARLLALLHQAQIKPHP